MIGVDFQTLMAAVLFSKVRSEYIRDADRMASDCSRMGCTKVSGCCYCNWDVDKVERDAAKEAWRQMNVLIDVAPEA